jgi:autotransporter-associated beta strand protein
LTPETLTAMHTTTNHSPARSTQTLVKFAATAALAALVCSSDVLAQLQPPSSGDRVTGLDISAWQGNWSTTQWATLHRPTNQSVGGVFGDGRDFVIIRSSRGGTTGYYNQSDSGNVNGKNTLSQRYDDPYFVQNITRATAAGMFAGPYHFGRMDIIASTLNANGIPNNGTDEANHFIQMAGPWMRPGYLLPMFDFEAGSAQRTPSELAQFAIDFSNRILAVKGIRPSVYIGGNYANPMNSIPESAAIVAALPTLITARWPNQTDPNSIPIQTANPGDYTSNVYGPWDNAPNPAHPWSYWQYASTGHLNAYSSNLDLDVAHGNIEFVKDTLVPALWTSASSGNWKDIASWNSGETPVAPVQGPGQVARVGTMVLPTPRMPGRNDAVTGVLGANDTVNLDRPNQNVTVTIDSTTPAIGIRRLNLNERLNVTGGSLNVGLTGFVSTGGTLALSGGTVTINDVTITADGTAQLSGGTLNAGDFHLNSDLSVNAPAAMNISRTATIDSGATLALGGGANLAGAVTVANGYLSLTANGQLGPAASVSTSQTTTAGGTVGLAGNVSYGIPITIGGSGKAVGNSNQGALENVSGNNTWSGAVILAGNQNNLGQANLNQINSTAGTLTLSGVMQNAVGLSASWAKTGAGDLVLTGGSPNTYTHLTRVFGGRLILEKDGALGGAGSSTIADGNTFTAANTVSTIAFRAPASSPAGFNYNTVEWIHTEGTGVSGFGQIDNLGGVNSFAGHLGLGGPLVNGVRQSSIGVTAGSLEIKGGLYARGTVDDARNVNKLGAGTLILSGDSGPAPTNSSDKSLINSTFTVTAGTVQLNGTAGNTANVPGVTTWNVNGATSKLTLARKNAAGGASIVLNGGTLQANANVTTTNPLTLLSTGTGGTVDAGSGATVNASTLTNAGGRTLTKTGPGTLNVTGAQSHSTGAALNVSAGVINLNTNSGSNASPVLAVSNIGGAVNFNARQDLAGLTMVGTASAAALTAGGDKVLNTGALSLLNLPKLDLANNAMVVRSASLSTISGYLKTGFAAGAWNGPGVNSSAAGADASHITALGSASSGALNLTNFKGVTGLTGNEVLVAYTYYGDADLTGAVTLDDFTLFLRGYQNNGTTWFAGDFDYSGQVTLDDFTLFLKGYQHQGPSLAEIEGLINGVPMSPAERAAMLAAVAVVPEPSSIATFAVLALAAGARGQWRRRARPGV